MAEKFAILQRIDHDRVISKVSDYEFFYRLQNGLLLVLKERGILNEIQYRIASEVLDAQRYEHTGDQRSKRGKQP